MSGQDNRTEGLRIALLYSPSFDASALQSRMGRCGSSDWNGHFTCRTPGCSSCRGRYIGQQCRSARRRFSEVPNEDLAFATIVVGATDHVDDIPEIAAKFRKDVRNLVDSKRRERRRWRDLEMLMWLEVDAFASEDFPLLGPEKRAQLGDLVPMVSSGKPIWVITFHGIVRLNGLDHQEVWSEMERKWSAPKQVDLRRFFNDRSKDQNINATINYSLKHENRTHLGRIEERWPVSWAVEYYTFLFRWSRGFQSLKVSISP